MTWGYRGESGKEHGNYYFIMGLYRGYRGDSEKKREATIYDALAPWPFQVSPPSAALRGTAADIIVVGVRGDSGLGLGFKVSTLCQIDPRPHLLFVT